MSAYKRIRCTLKDRATLLAALRSLGLTPEEHETPTALYGFQGDERAEKADIIIPRSLLNKQFTGASNDLGFAWNAETEQFDMICSVYDASLRVPERVMQAYALAAIETALTENRFQVERPSTNVLHKRRRTTVQVIGRKLL